LQLKNKRMDEFKQQKELEQRALYNKQKAKGLG
jgi:hypothetical protein